MQHGTSINFLHYVRAFAKPYISGQWTPTMIT